MAVGVGTANEKKLRIAFYTDEISTPNEGPERMLKVEKCADADENGDCGDESGVSSPKKTV